MKMLRLHASPLTLASIVCAAVCTARCGSSSPSTPTPTGPSVTGITMTVSTIGVGSTTQATVTLASAPTTAATVTLTSSNPAVATVQSPVTIPAGASSTAFTITGVAAGTATITAAVNGSTSQSPVVTVTRVALATFTLSASTVVGGNSVTGTIGLTAAAPLGGAAVAITAADPLVVPSTVTVPSGLTTVTFTVQTRSVGGTIAGTVTAAYGGDSKSAPLSVTKPSVATASFGVSGPTETDTCTMANSGNVLNCMFNGSTSSAPGNIVAYDWTYRVGTATPFTQTTTGVSLANPAVNCSFLPPPPLPAGGNQWLPLTVTLKVHDDLGNVSTEVSNNGGARVFPQGVCGY